MIQPPSIISLIPVKFTHSLTRQQGLIKFCRIDETSNAGVAELADATDSKSVEGDTSCGFESHLRYQQKAGASTVSLF